MVHNILEGENIFNNIILYYKSHKKLFVQSNSIEPTCAKFFGS